MTVAQLIHKLKKLPQDAIVTMSNNNCYTNGEYIVTSIKDDYCDTVEICTNYERNLTNEW